ncbi:Uncharacterised protein [Serratia rubidaea]|uniref:Uncharacterized protein n=1 Tax=Serratia rubidaea TaxID=61652 RepID=A0A3S5DFL3_SERRU|nr:Uncharacterised protein [Serratia rubidaea]
MICERIDISSEAQCLIGDDHLRLQDQRPRQRHALFLAGGQHMRVIIGVSGSMPTWRSVWFDAPLALQRFQIGIHPQRASRI